MTSFASPLGPSLPREITDYIIDEVHTKSLRASPHDTSETLKNCTLVSKSWRDRSRHHLFSGCIRVAPEYPPHDQIQQVVQFLEDNPEIARNTNGVALDFRVGDNSFAVFRSQHFKDLFNIIKGQGRPFTTLKILGSSTNPDLQSRGPVKNYNAKPFDVFGQLFAPSITCLHVESFQSLPLNLITRCVNIKELSLFEVDFAHHPSYVRLPPPKLDKLAICAWTHRSMNFVTFFRDVLDAATLQSLTIYFPKMTTEYGMVQDRIVNGMIDHSFGSLEEYRVKLFDIPRYDKEYRTLDSGLSASRFGNLRSLEFDILLQNLHPDIPDTERRKSISEVHNTLLRIPKLNKIERIRFTVYFGFSSTNIVFAPLAEIWGELKHILKRILAGKSACVELHVIYANRSDYEMGLADPPGDLEVLLLPAEGLVNRQCDMATQYLGKRLTEGWDPVKFVISHSVYSRAYTSPHHGEDFVKTET